MKIIVYIVIIVLLVGCAFAGVKALKQSSLFQSVANAVDTVKDFVDNTGDGSNGSSSQSGEGDNQSGESGSQNQSENGGGSQDGQSGQQNGLAVTEIVDANLCNIFYISKGGTATARHIVVGDVFEAGDVITWDKTESTSTISSWLANLADGYDFEYWRTLQSYDVYVCNLFGEFNPLFRAAKYVNGNSVYYYLWLGPSTYFWTDLLNNGFSSLSGIELVQSNAQNASDSSLHVVGGGNLSWRAQ